MQPTAVSQVIEALGKLVLGLFFAVFAKRMGCNIESCAAYAALGLTAGSFLCMVYLLLTKSLTRLAIPNIRQVVSVDSFGSIFKRLFFLAVPVTLSSSLSGITRVIDMSMIFRRLQSIGYESSVAAAMYGCYSTLAVPVYNLPSSFVAGISLSLVPMLTAAVEAKDAKRSTDLMISSLKMCLFFSLPCSFGIAVFAKPLLSLLFVGEQTSVAVAAPLLTVLSFSVCSSCLMGVTNAVLQAYRKVSLPIVSMFLGTAIKIVSAYLLMGIPSIGIYGAAISTLFGNTVAVGLNLYFIDRKIVADIDVLKISLPSVVASFLAVGISFGVWRLLCIKFLEGIGLLFSILICVLLYLYIGGRMGIYSEREIGLLPGGKHLLRFLLVIGLIKKQKEKDKKHEQRGYCKKTS